MPRIHILGASGSGATTLGAALAQRLGVPQLDADSIYWRPTDPPFTEARPIPERLALLHASLPSAGGWVFSGSSLGWANPAEPLYELIVYLRLDPAIRMERLRRRERLRYGRRIEPAGDMAEAHRAFFVWAAAYDTAGLEQRSQTAHEAWLAGQTIPVIRLDSAEPTPHLVRSVLQALGRR
jgi:adenylate kinase family enzyme